MEFKSEARTENLNVRKDIFLGESDIAALVLRFYDKVDLLKMGGDGAYKAHIIFDDEEIPGHYHKEVSGEAWCNVYDDYGLTATFRASTIDFYRAGEMGILIVLSRDAEVFAWSRELYKSKVLAIHCEKPRGVYTADRETGSFIDEFETVGDALSAIRQYEEADKAEGIYERGFYDVVDGNHVSYIR